MEDEEVVNSSPVNNTSPTGFENFFAEHDKILDRKAKAKKGNPGFAKMLGSAGASVYRGENTGLGESKYDDNINWDSDVDANDVQGSINEHRYEQQGWFTQASAGVARAATKAVIEVAKMPGVVIGAIAAPFVEDESNLDTIFNNPWIKAMDSLNETVNTELLPVYVGKAIKEGNLWDNITSTSFWATEGADGLGFMLSMLVPGALINRLGLGAKLLGAEAKAMRAMSISGKMEEATQVLNSLGKTANAIDVATGATVNTMVEAGAEAKGVGDSMDREKDTFITNYINKNKATTEEAEEAFTQQRAQAMKDVFVSNLAILIGPNLLMSKALFGTASDKFVAETTKDTVKNRALQSGKRWGKAFLSEGFIEEGGQSTVENVFRNKGLNNELGKGNDFNIGELAKGYADTISSTEGQKAIFLGGMMGSPMMSYQGRKEDVANREKSNTILENVNSRIGNFNTILENDIYKKDENGEHIYEKDMLGNNTGNRILDKAKALEVLETLNYKEGETEALEEAIQRGDSDVVDQIKQAAVFDLIFPAIHNDKAGLDVLEQQLNESEKFQEIVEREQDPKRKGEFRNFITETLDAAKHLQEQNKKFREYGEHFIEMKDDRATPELKKEFINKLNNSYLAAKHQLYNDEKKLKEVQDKRKNFYEELGLDHNYNGALESPGSKISGGIVSNKNVEEEVKKVQDAKESNSLVKLLEDQHDMLQKRIKKTKKDIAEVWNGKDNLDKSFKKFINHKLKVEDDLSDDNEAAAQAELDTIDSINDIDELKKVKTKNPHVQERIDIRMKELIKEKEEKDEIVRKANEDKADAQIVKFEDTTTPVIVQLSDLGISIDGNIFTDPGFEEPVGDSENYFNTHEELKQTQPGAKVLSTDRTTGKRLPFVSQEYLNYERNSKDKSKDSVEFEINETPGDDINLSKALAIFKKGVFTSKDDVNFLYNYLPINTRLAGTVSAPLETKPSTAQGSTIFKRESLELRKNIIDSLILGTPITELKSNVVKQFPGQLKVSPQIRLDDGSVITPTNNIRKLWFFEHMDDKTFIKEFAKRAYFVDYTGQLASVLDVDKKISSGHEGKGEVFVQIPQNNGKPFLLKLNFGYIARDKASGIYDIMKVLSANVPTIENPLGFTTTIEEFIASHQAPDYIENMFKAEIEIIKKSYKNAGERTIDKLLDMLVYQKSANKKTLFQLDKAGNLKLGSLASVKKVSAQDLVDDTHREAIVDFLTRKRSNVMITDRYDNTTFNNVSRLF
jgi:hypothetical protein